MTKAVRVITDWSDDRILKKIREKYPHIKRKNITYGDVDTVLIVDDSTEVISIEFEIYDKLASKNYKLKRKFDNI